MKHWYALHVRSNHEKKAREYLASRSIETFLPLYRVQSRRRDRRAIVDKPLFSGYVFVRSAMERGERIEILRAPGLARLVGFEAGPAPIPDSTVEAVRVVVGSGRNPEPFPFLSRGKRVRLVAGPLAGIEGFIVDASDGRKRVVVSVEILGRSVSATVERDELEPGEE